MVAVMTIEFLAFTTNGRTWTCCHPRIPVPEPYQAGVEDPWVVWIPKGRWTVRLRHRICPLEHPVDLLR